MDHYDIVIIGGGMAGASIAAELADHASVAIAEAEDRPGYHATGRSAAFREECYGGPDVVPLTLASGEYLREGGFLTQRPGLYIAREGQEDALAAFGETFTAAGVTVEPLDRSALAARLPGLREGWSRALLQPNCADIDVGALHQHYLALARRGGVQLRVRHRLVAAERDGARWRLDFGPAGELSARVIVNAAGAWADPVATACGVRPLGITPFRRSVAQLRTDPPVAADLPLVLDLAGEFYFRPEHGKLWLSPHDETPSLPCDAAPEEIDIALAIDRFEQVVDWRIAAVEHKWAGLRSFAPDRLPVYGYDADAEGFFWFAGQGGYGIQTAPAAARLGAQLLTGTPRCAMTEPLNVKLYHPARFAPAMV